MKGDKYIMTGECGWDVRDCEICRKPTLHQLIDGKWKCTEHGKNKGHRKDDEDE